MNRFEKEKLIRDVKDLLKKYNFVYLVNLENTPTNLINKVKNYFKTDYFKQIKSSLLSLIFEKEIKGQNLLILTNKNIVETLKTIEKEKLYAIYKINEIADTRFVIKQGPTNVRPSLFTRLLEKTANLKLEKGFVTFKEDYIVFKPGDLITDFTYQILKEFNYKPKIKFLKLNYIIYRNKIIEPTVLKNIYNLPILLQQLEQSIIEKMNTNYIYSIPFLKKEIYKLKKVDEILSITENKENKKEVKKEEDLEEIFL